MTVNDVFAQSGNLEITYKHLIKHDVFVIA